MCDLGDDVCDRCGCCGTYWEDCHSCGGEGGLDWEDLQFVDPLWYSPGDFVKCDVCSGVGGWFVCLGDCDENGKHK